MDDDANEKVNNNDIENDSLTKATQKFGEKVDLNADKLKAQGDVITENTNQLKDIKNQVNLSWSLITEMLWKESKFKILSMLCAFIMFLVDIVLFCLLIACWIKRL